jgi:4-hydroxy-2-oxoheptanedioate aldolase
VPGDTAIPAGRYRIIVTESVRFHRPLPLLLDVPGFDGILFGPGDFSHRIGKAGQLDVPEVVAARKRVGAACLRHGKFCMAAGLYAPFNDMLAEGYRVFNIGADVIALGSYVKQRLEVVQGHIKALPANLQPPTRSPYE